MDGNGSMDTTSNSSASNASFNTQVAYKYLKAKEQLGLMSATTDGIDYISDDSDSSDSLNRDLMETK